MPTNVPIIKSNILKKIVSIHTNIKYLYGSVGIIFPIVINLIIYSCDCILAIVLFIYYVIRNIS